MNINYKSRNLEITEAMKEYCEKRLNKFDKLIGPETAVVTMSSIRDRQRLEVTIPYHGTVSYTHLDVYKRQIHESLDQEFFRLFLNHFRPPLLVDGR